MGRACLTMKTGWGAWQAPARYPGAAGGEDRLAGWSEDLNYFQKCTWKVSRDHIYWPNALQAAPCSAVGHLPAFGNPHSSQGGSQPPPSDAFFSRCPKSNGMNLSACASARKRLSASGFRPLGFDPAAWGMCIHPPVRAMAEVLRRVCSRHRLGRGEQGALSFHPVHDPGPQLR